MASVLPMLKVVVTMSQKLPRELPLQSVGKSRSLDLVSCSRTAIYTSNNGLWMILDDFGIFVTINVSIPGVVNCEGLTCHTPAVLEMACWKPCHTLWILLGWALHGCSRVGPQHSWKQLMRFNRQRRLWLYQRILRGCPDIKDIDVYINYR